MSILYFILALFACAVSGIGGAFWMRFVSERNREIAEQEDPRDTKIRDLQAKIKLIGDDMTQDREKAVSATEHVKLAHDRITELLDETKDLKRSKQDKEALQGNDSDEKELLRDKLSVANKQLDTLRQRNQELEVELSVTGEPDMLATLDDESHDGDDELEEHEADPFTPTVADNSPSLIHALTGELDRWKRHCHVLGDELKNQRDRVIETDEVTANATATIPEIDELTDIRGIGNVLAKKLHMLGIYSYENLLNLSDDDIERAREMIPDFERRMERDGWLEQARTLQACKYRPGMAQADCTARP
jgi:predicted flap endonuclease-1-like 5' DNA nuclease